MPRTNINKLNGFTIRPDEDLNNLLTSRSKSLGVTKNEYIIGLICRGLFAEDVETIRKDLENVVGKISKSGGMNKNEQRVLMEILAYMRMYFAENNPSNVTRAKEFVNSYVDKLSGESEDE